MLETESGKEKEEGVSWGLGLLALSFNSPPSIKHKAFNFLFT